ncbi:MULTISPECIES: restriction endonuclease subunit S [unclassified Mammaliicoccus]|uniref:restriction endonuclease subunit S n=1 Tax=unclassified Mammaliicoccus TaxID=2803851 RepID=UPI001EFB8338|nr:MULTISPECIES: restriction endonuclease subunit S [unclassified Mammaliicoccus]
MEFKNYKIKDIGEVVTGFTPSKREKDLYGFTFPFITPSDIANSKYVVPKRFLSEQAISKKEKKVCSESSVGISCIGSDLGKAFFMQKVSFTNQQINTITNIKKNFDPEYIYYKIKTFRDYFHRIADGSTMPIINKSKFENLSLEIPSLKNQKKISGILSILDNKIELNKKIIANLEELSQTLFKRWFVDFEFPDENGNPYKSSGGDMVESELGVIPKDWSIQTLNDISESYNTKRKPLSKLEREKVASIYPYYGATKIIDYVDDYLFDGKFILVGEDGTVQTEEGHPFVQYVWGQFWVSNHAHILKGKNLSDEVLMLILNNIDIQPYITGAVQPKISKKNLNSIKIVVGSKLIYGKFDQYINTYYKKIREVHDENKYLTQLRDTLLPKLMSGEIEIPDDIEVNEDELSI